MFGRRLPRIRRMTEPDRRAASLMLQCSLLYALMLADAGYCRYVIAAADTMPIRCR